MIALEDNGAHKKANPEHQAPCAGLENLALDPKQQGATDDFCMEKRQLSVADDGLNGANVKFSKLVYRKTAAGAGGGRRRW